MKVHFFPRKDYASIDSLRTFFPCDSQQPDRERQKTFYFSLQLPTPYITCYDRVSFVSTCFALKHTSRQLALCFWTPEDSSERTLVFYLHVRSGVRDTFCLTWHIYSHPTLHFHLQPPPFVSFTMSNSSLMLLFNFNAQIISFFRNRTFNTLLFYQCQLISKKILFFKLNYVYCFLDEENLNKFKNNY